MANHRLKNELEKELQQTLKIKRLNLDLMDSLESTILFLMSESEKNNQKLPNLSRLDSLLKRVWTLYSNINREFTRIRSTTDFTEPKF